MHIKGISVKSKNKTVHKHTDHLLDPAALKR